jgi:site-specific recombinase XerD
MLEFYVESEFKRRALRQCPVGDHLDGFAEWLRLAGYQRRPGQLLLRGAAHLGHWSAARGARRGRITAGVLAAFVRHLPTCACPHPFRGRDRYHREAAQRFFTHCQRVGVVRSPTAAAERVAPVVEQFGAWMRQHRGVRESTLGNYVPLVQEFLATLGDDAAAYDAARVRAFILARASRSGRSRAKSVVNAVRMFLRFLAVGGACPADLVAAVPAIADWKLAALPRYLAAPDIERLVAACAPATPAGARDRAVILLLARLGLRAGDVRELRLGDIDWARGRLRLMGKGRCETWLPLPQEVGDAVLHYLTRARPASEDDHVFLRVHAPIGPLPSSGPISKLVRRAIHRAGIAAPSLGAHVLRHSAATALLRQGATLDVIGAVLRHRCIESTAHYAKVDAALLRAVVQPWPAAGGVPC